MALTNDVEVTSPLPGQVASLHLFLLLWNRLQGGWCVRWQWKQGTRLKINCEGDGIEKRKNARREREFKKLIKNKKHRRTRR